MTDRLNELEQDIANKTGLSVETVHRLDEAEAKAGGETPEEAAAYADEKINEAIDRGDDVSMDEESTREELDNIEAVQAFEEAVAELEEEFGDDIDEDDCGDDD